MYDAAGQLLQVREGVGIACGNGVACEQARETWSYTPNGQKEGLWDARGNLTCFYYDGHDRALATEYPDLSKEGSAAALPARVSVAGQPTRCGVTKTAAMLSEHPGQYDLAGNVLKVRNREGAFIVRTYDALDRRLTEKGLWTDGITAGHASGRSWRMRDATFDYWPSGRMISASTDQVTKAWCYDTAGRPSKHMASTPAPNAASYTFTYGWDVAGNLTSVGYPTVASPVINPGTLTATYAYDALNRMTGVTTTGVKAASASLTYDTLSRRKSVTFGDNSTQTYDYEADDDLSSIAHTFVTSPATNNVTLTYGNDRLGRQVSETTSNAAYLYDPPLAATGPYGAATSLNQYPTVGSTTYSYTPNDPALLPSGVVTSDGVRAFFYDERGNLTKARQGLESAGNFDQDSFDALGVRWFSYRTAPAASDPSRVELTDGLRPEVVWELHSTTAEGSTTPTVNGAQYYVLGPNPDERLIWINGTEASVKARYPHTNRRGDTIAMGRDGIAETKFKYGPFGESADSTAGYPYRFTGQRLNSWTGLYHFKARAYAPGIGRFLQPDPIGYGDGPSLYAYVGNDPYNATDPDGLQQQTNPPMVVNGRPQTPVGRFSANQIEIWNAQGRALSSRYQGYTYVGEPGVGQIGQAREMFARFQARWADSRGVTLASSQPGAAYQRTPLNSAASGRTDFFVTMRGSVVGANQQQMRDGFNSAGFSSTQLGTGTEFRLPNGRDVRLMEPQNTANGAGRRASFENGRGGYVNYDGKPVQPPRGTNDTKGYVRERTHLDQY